MKRRILLGIIVLSVILLTMSYSQPAFAQNQEKILYPKDRSKVHVLSPRDINRNERGEARNKFSLPDLSKPNKWAILIGIADYEGKSNDLWHPDEDAREMYNVLINKYGFARDHIILLTNKKATAKAIPNAIDWLLKWENETSLVVFFYSGHGYNASEEETSSVGYPVDEVDGVDECIISYDLYAIPDDLLSAKLSELDSRNVFLWFGSCFSGGMDDVYRALNVKMKTVVLTTACQEHQLSYDVLRLRNTLFGYYYIDEGMKQEMADGYGNNGVIDGTVTVEEAFYYADQHVNTFVQLYGLDFSDPEVFDSDVNTDFYL